jgi:hypothetical protein
MIINKKPKKRKNSLILLLPTIPKRIYFPANLLRKVSPMFKMNDFKRKGRKFRPNEIKEEIFHDKTKQRR